MTEDEQHLRWLSVFHYILATLSALYILFFVAVFGMSGVADVPHHEHAE